MSSAASLLCSQYGATTISQSVIQANTPVLRFLTSAGRLATKVGKLSIGLVKNSMLLFEGHGVRILVRITMETSLAAKVLANWKWNIHRKSGRKWVYISCPASLTMAHSLGKVSREWPGMNQVVLISYLAKSFRSRGTPTLPAKRPESDCSAKVKSRLEEVDANLVRCHSPNPLHHRSQAILIQHRCRPKCSKGPLW